MAYYTAVVHTLRIKTTWSVPSPGLTTKCRFGPFFFETVPEEKEMLAKVLINSKAQRLLTDAPDCRFSFAFTDRQWRWRRSAGMNRRITVFTVTQLKVSLILKVCLSVRRPIVGSCQKILKLIQTRKVWSCFDRDKFGTETKKLLLSNVIVQSSLTFWPAFSCSMLTVKGICDQHSQRLLWCCQFLPPQPMFVKVKPQSWLLLAHWDRWDEHCGVFCPANTPFF